MIFKNTFFYCFIALLFSCFYILTTTQVPAMVHVGISWFTAYLEQPSIHPNHLLPGVYLHYWVNFLTVLGFSFDPLRMMVSINSIFGGLSIALFVYTLNVRLFLSKTQSFLSACLLAFMFCFWYSVCSVEVFGLSILCFIICLNILLNPNKTTLSYFFL